MRKVVVSGEPTGFRQSILIGSHLLHADAPLELGGEDTGPEPEEYLLAALGACTSMTLRMYAQKKGIRLSNVRVHVQGDRTPDAFVIRRVLQFEGELDAEEKARLLEIAEKCPVSRTLRSTIRIDSSLLDD